MIRPATRKLALAVLLVAAAATFAAEVDASHAVTSVMVSAIIRNACTADTDAQVAGKHVVATAAVSATGEVSVDCTIHIPYSVAMNTGTVRGAAVNANAVTTAANSQSYTLYRDDKYTAPWGTGAGPETQSGTYNARQPLVPVYGRIGRASLKAGDASNADLITLSVNY